MKIVGEDPTPDLPVIDGPGRANDGEPVRYSVDSLRNYIEQAAERRREDSQNRTCFLSTMKYT